MREEELTQNIISRIVAWGKLKSSRSKKSSVNTIVHFLEVNLESQHSLLNVYFSFLVSPYYQIWVEVSYLEFLMLTTCTLNWILLRVSSMLYISGSSYLSAFDIYLELVMFKRGGKQMTCVQLDVVKKDLTS